MKKHHFDKRQKRNHELNWQLWMKVSSMTYPSTVLDKKVEAVRQLGVSGGDFDCFLCISHRKWVDKELGTGSIVCNTCPFALAGYDPEAQDVNCYASDSPYTKIILTRTAHMRYIWAVRIAELPWTFGRTF